MDVRIVNTCNNNCTYCLEQSLRGKDMFIDKQEIYDILKNTRDKDVLSFYGGNPLLHPDLLDIIAFARSIGFKNISLLSNTYKLSEIYLSDLVRAGLTGISFYFNSFSTQKHNTIINNGISLKELIKNIGIIKNSAIPYKAIIHINYQNITDVSRDLLILYTKFGVKVFDFVNYFPFDRPYDRYSNTLEYSIGEKRIYIDNIFKIINKLNLQTKFLKFSRDFFGRYGSFYDFENGVINQIGEEDIKRLESKKPFCFIENRCEYCFIKDNCKSYGL